MVDKRWHTEAMQDNPQLNSTLDEFPHVRANTYEAESTAANVDRRGKGKGRKERSRPVLSQSEFAVRLKELIPKAPSIVSKKSKAIKAIHSKTIVATFEEYPEKMKAFQEFNQWWEAKRKADGAVQDQDQNPKKKRKGHHWNIGRRLKRVGERGRGRERGRGGGKGRGKGREVKGSNA